MLSLELQVDLIEGRERLADLDGLADLDQALGNLAGDAKTEIALDPRPDGADEAALRRFGIIMGGCDQNRPRRLGLFSNGVIAPAQGDSHQRQRHTRQQLGIARQN
ncbi:hypothetical protein ACVWWR_005085 [Bradyrhizobium sp. LM3.2]